jgi:hypothetical protein
MQKSINLQLKFNVQNSKFKVVDSIDLSDLWSKVGDLIAVFLGLGSDHSPLLSERSGEAF